MQQKTKCVVTHKKTKFWEFDGNGQASEINEQQSQDSQNLVWIQLTVTSAKQYFKKYADIPPTVAEILTTKNPRPKTIVLHDSLIGIFRGVNFNKGCAPEDMISVRIWLHQNKIITIQRHKSVTLNEVEHALKMGAGPKNSAEFLQYFLEIISDKSTESIAKPGDRLDALENSLDGKLTKEDHSALNDMQKRIILLRRYLIPQREAIARIPIDRISWLHDFSALQLREIIDTNLRMIEDLDAERDRSRVIADSIFSKAQESINQKMYLLSIIAVIFMPLGFIAGVFGMNLGGIPGLNYKFGFMIVCVTMFVLFLLQLIWLKFKRWI